MSKVIDYRKLSPEAQTQIRTVAIKRREAGESADAVARSLECARSAVFAWQQRYRAGGWAALVTRQRPGAQPRIDWMALLQVKGWVCEHTPDEYPLPGKWWTRVLVQALIERTFGTRYGLPQISHFLHRLGLSPQRPLYRALQQDLAAVERWRREVFPGLVAQAHQRKARLWCAEESAVGSTQPSGTTWGRQGETPVVRDTAERFGRNLLSAISPRGECRFEVTARRGTAALFIAFLDQRRAGQERPLLLIVDTPLHRSRAVQASGQRTQGERELHDAPAYAPEPNPDEWLWNDLKTQGVDRLKFTSTCELKRLIETHLQHLQTLPEKITSFFLGKPREYIAQSGLLVTD